MRASPLIALALTVACAACSSSDEAGLDAAWQASFGTTFDSHLSWATPIPHEAKSLQGKAKLDSIIRTAQLRTLYEREFRRGIDSARHDLRDEIVVRCRQEGNVGLDNFPKLHQEDAFLADSFGVATRTVFTDTAPESLDDAFWVGYCSTMQPAVETRLAALGMPSWEYMYETGRTAQIVEVDPLHDTDWPKLFDYAIHTCGGVTGVSGSPVVALTPDGDVYLERVPDGTSPFDSLEILRFASGFPVALPTASEPHFVTYYVFSVFPTMNPDETTCSPGWSTQFAEAAAERKTLQNGSL